jgi:hypothetical protein
MGAGRSADVGVDVGLPLVDLGVPLSTGLGWRVGVLVGPDVDGGVDPGMAVPDGNVPEIGIVVEIAGL